ncbi:MAG: hypothetical protein PVH88_26465, partial [Ignavibacteria bacterium]
VIMITDLLYAQKAIPKVINNFFKKMLSVRYLYLTFSLIDRLGYKVFMISYKQLIYNKLPII